MQLDIDIKTQRFIDENINADVHSLALKYAADKSINLAFALMQIEARQHAKNKIPSWFANKNIIFPPNISMEQCSSEYTAKYKATLCKGALLLDLTGGFGVDFAYMSQNFAHAIYVEKNKNLEQIAKHNFEILDLKNTETICKDAVEALDACKFADCIYLDPARRDEQNKKQILLENCSPNILQIKNKLLQKAESVIVKLSPLFDISELLRTIDEIKEIHIVAVQNECKELLVIMNKNEQSCNAKIVCANITKSGIDEFEFAFANEKDVQCNFVEQPQKYLYEPNAAIQKSGGFKSYAQKTGLNILNLNSKIYTSDNKISNFCGRTFVVDDIVLYKRNMLKKEFANLQKANITVRNFPLSVADLRKQLNIGDGGDVYIFATTLFNGEKVLIKSHKDI